MCIRDRSGQSVGHQVNPLSDQQTVNRITDQFKFEDDTMFGLMNAVTAVARETQDPALQWELEKLGGRFLALVPTPHVSNHDAEQRRRKALVHQKAKAKRAAKSARPAAYSRT